MRMLVVDDEYYAIKGITEAIDWSDLPFDEILEAGDVEDAKQLLKTQPIDVMISDIEMPGENGLDLLEWVKKESPRTETVFLTGHANFSYAQQAIRLGSFDYVLKPVDHDQLKQIVAEAVKKIQEERQQEDFNETYRSYYQHWQNQLPLLVERFWVDLLSERIPARAERLQSSFELYEIPLAPDSRIFPILLSIEEWKLDLNTRDEEIMEYALRKAASEIILADWPGIVIADPAGYNLVLIYDLPAESGKPDSARHELAERCMEYVKACMGFFHCNLSCYIGRSSGIPELLGSVKDLLELERQSVTGVGRVIFEEAAGEKKAAEPYVVPAVHDLKVLMEAGKRDEVYRRIQESVKRIQTHNARLETLESFYYGISSILYELAAKKNLSIQKLFPDRELQDVASACKSVTALQHWALRVAGRLLDAIGQDKDTSAVVSQVKAYIAEHLEEEFSREDLAAMVYLNPAYLSRLFKKETGISLSEYIVRERMEKAKQLLTEGNAKVSSVAEKTGYSHFSHFAKMFKKTVGISPQEYRKKFQGTEE